MITDVPALAWLASPGGLYTGSLVFSVERLVDGGAFKMQGLEQHNWVTGGTALGSNKPSSRGTLARSHKQVVIKE